MSDVNQKMRRRIKKVVRVMTDPKPLFVSLVDHGANFTPFAVVKRDDPAVVADIRHQEDDPAMSTQKSTQDTEATLSGAAVTHFRFPANKFDADSATRYMQEAGYENVKLSEEEGYEGFVVKLMEDSEFDADSLATITLENGAEVSAIRQTEETAAADEGDEASGKSEEATDAAKAETDGPAADPAPVAKADEGAQAATHETVAELVAKFDEWEAQFSRGKTLAEVMSEGADGIPIGLYEVIMAFYTALRNSILTGGPADIRALTAEMGDLIVRMVEVFGDATIPAETVQMAQKRVAGPETLPAPEAPEPADSPEGDATAAAKDDGGEGEQTPEGATAKQEEGADSGGEAGGEEGAESANKQQDGPEVKLDSQLLSGMTALTEAVTALAQRMETMESENKVLQESIQSTAEESTTKVARVVADVESLKAATTQRRQSAAETFDGDLGANKDDNPERKRDGVADPLLRSTMGFMSKDKRA